jgi:hypothetical protein
MKFEKGKAPISPLEALKKNESRPLDRLVSTHSRSPPSYGRLRTVTAAYSFRASADSMEDTPDRRPSRATNRGRFAAASPRRSELDAGVARPPALLVQPRQPQKSSKAVVWLQSAAFGMQQYVLVIAHDRFRSVWERDQDVYDSAKSDCAESHFCVLIDKDGARPRLFGGVHLRDQTFLYDGEGRLRFEAAITCCADTKGAVNSGRADNHPYIAPNSTIPAKGKHPVFGCAISTKTALEEKTR